MIGLLASMVGGRGGSMLGRMIGGRTGAMIGGLAGSLIGGRKLSRLGRSMMNKKNGRGGGGTTSNSFAAEAGEADVISDADAATLIRAMCNAAKADGQVDEKEAHNISGELGDEVSSDERAFLEAELTSPMQSAADMAAAIPADLRDEAYAVSLMTVEVDSVEEAQYLQDFAAALGLSSDDVSEIHAELGV